MESAPDVSTIKLSFRGGLARLRTYLLYGGTQRARTYELEILEHVIRLLPPSDAEALQAQLRQLDLLQRAAKDRMLTFYFYDQDRLPRMQERAEEHSLGVFDVRSKETFTKATVVSSRGLLSSIEFSKSPAALEGQVLEISRTEKKSVSLTEALDRFEHGRPE